MLLHSVHSWQHRPPEVPWTKQNYIADGIGLEIVEFAGKIKNAQRSALAELPGPIVLPQAGCAGYRLDWLVEEVSTSINTTAAGGNASLMAIG